MFTINAFIAPSINVLSLLCRVNVAESSSSTNDLQEILSGPTIDNGIEQALQGSSHWLREGMTQYSEHTTSSVPLMTEVDISYV